eukprot:TRINITY_DN24698_c0_g1_i1.p2 TRINITY_DN24698_c0_g1~~TRINITY_DN24698_c0_g1_i1.p2  ORF type:complete len:359 (+),score=67.15 TRINITY_DN24698_c0_g1_i1:111-1079(+)
MSVPPGKGPSTPRQGSDCAGDPPLPSPPPVDDGDVPFRFQGHPAPCVCVRLAGEGKGGYGGIDREPFCAVTGLAHEGCKADLETVTLRRPLQVPPANWGILWVGVGKERPKLRGFTSSGCAKPAMSAHLYRHRVVGCNGVHVQSAWDLERCIRLVPPEQQTLQLVFLHTKECCGGSRPSQWNRPASAGERFYRRGLRNICELCLCAMGLVPYCPLTGEPHEGYMGISAAGRAGSGRESSCARSRSGSGSRSSSRARSRGRSRSAGAAAARGGGVEGPSDQDQGRKRFAPLLPNVPPARRKTSDRTPLPPGPPLPPPGSPDDE